jgi:hypothetical protein
MVKVGDLVVVHWIDACEHNNIDVDDLKGNLLKEVWTYGRVRRNDDKILFVATDEYSDNLFDGVAIPKAWIPGNGVKKLVEENTSA